MKGLLIALAIAVLPGALAAQEVSRGDGVVFFESKIRPLLSGNCFKCHGAKKQKAGLRLDSRARILKGGESGPAIAPGAPDKSLMIEAVTYKNSDLEMPPKKKLGKRQVEDLTRWIAMGAPWPEGEGPAIAGDSQEKKQFEITAEDRAYWAFQPLRERSEARFDEIIDAVMAQKGLAPNPPASRTTLIRRAYFDLIGLPPTYEEAQAFVADPDPEAFGKLVDRLLARPEYGERWGRHWLDVVRFAQSNGYERDDEKPNAWRYRDYVIASFNEDKPYDRFVLEQIAGDELPDGGDAGWIATGFHRLGVWDDEPDDKRAAEFDGQDDILKTTTETFLGLTVGCARCHDHMFDPISQRNYYELIAFFRNVRPYAHPRDKTKGHIIRGTGGGEALVVTEQGADPIDTHVLIRGNAGRPAEKVEPKFPGIFGAGNPKVTPTEHSAGRRLALAKWIARKDNPLTARVMVNRIWQFHTGRGIVATPNDFGQAGHPPSNVALLDWLAAEFVEKGWSVKHLHRVIMHSRAWQRSSAPNAANEARDPGNLHHWRANLRRLESEGIRDAILKCAGVLNPERGGRGFFPALAGEVVAGASKPGRNWQWSPEDQQRRRSVYAFVKRTMLYPFFEIFDYANTEGSLGARPTTTVAPQALLLLNGELVAENATRLAERARKDSDPVAAAFRLVLSRDPTTEERALAASYLAAQEVQQRALAGQFAFNPDYPPALFKDYHRNLPAGRFLRGPKDGWQYSKGRWTGGYEEILNVDPLNPPFALLESPRNASAASGKLRMSEVTKHATLHLKARPAGDRLDGYEFLIDVGAGEIAIRRKEGDKMKVLARQDAMVAGSSLLPFAAGINEGRLYFDVAGVHLEAEAGEAPEGEQFGVATFGGPLIFDGLALTTPEAAGAVVVHPPDPDFASRRAFEEFCGMLFNLNEFVYID